MDKAGTTIIEICGDGIDNNCDGQVDEGCGKILQYYSGTGQEGFICETLKESFTVKVASSSDEPEAGVGINWQITNAPAGDTRVTPTNSATDSGGLASSTLTLGNLPGDYTVDATCSECTEGSSQTFTATAKCPDVPQYYQDDYSAPYDDWCKYTYYDAVAKKTVTQNTTCLYDTQRKPLSGYEQYTIAQKGCALTSMAMVMGRYGNSAFPSTWNRFLTQIGGYTEDGNVWWTVPDIITGEGIKYIDNPAHEGDFNRSITVPKNLMDDYLKKCMPVIVQVYNATTRNRHWVVVTGKSGDDYTINDPSKENNYKFLSQYGNIYKIRPYVNKNGGCQ